VGNSSIKITADCYGHLVPGADISWVDRLRARLLSLLALVKRISSPYPGLARERQKTILDHAWIPPLNAH
jgi:hypothetical protein